MSAEHAPWAMQVRPNGLGPGTRMTLMLLAEMASDGAIDKLPANSGPIPLAELCEMGRMSPEMAAQHLDFLVSIGLISVSSDPDRFVLNLDAQ